MNSSWIWFITMICHVSVNMMFNCWVQSEPKSVKRRSEAFFVQPIIFQCYLRAAAPVQAGSGSLLKVWSWFNFNFIYHNWAFMLDDQVRTSFSERPHDFQPLVCCCYCLVPYIRLSLIVLLVFTCSSSPHSSSCSISQALLWSQSALTGQSINLKLGEFR